MKKFASMLLIALLATAVFAGDITAITGSGAVVVLHDNGKWEYLNNTTSQTTSTSQQAYLGKWGFTDKSMTAMVDNLMALSGVSKSDPYYDLYVGIFSAQLRENMPDESLMTIELKNNGVITLTTDGETEEAQYRITSLRALNVIENGVEMEFGVFNENYTELKFTMGGPEVALLGMNFYKLK